MKPDPTDEPMSRGLSLTEHVARRINDWIVAQELRPGDPLPTEQDLIQRFGVARSVVREALMRLRALGVAEVRRGRGTFVAEMPIGLLQARLRRVGQDPRQGLPHLIELRRLLVADAAELAAQRAGKPDLERLEAVAAQVRAAAKAGDAGAAMEQEEIFHVLLAQTSGNPVLEQLLAGALPMLREVEEKRWRAQGACKALSGGLRKVFEAIAAAEPVAARRAALAHLAALGDDAQAPSSDQGLPRGPERARAGL